MPQRDYADLFECLKSGGADCLAIPIKNSTAGSVFPYCDLMLAHTTGHGFRIWRSRKGRLGDYSDRRARSGSMRDARLAGI